MGHLQAGGAQGCPCRPARQSAAHVDLADDTWTKYASQPEFNNFVDSFKKIQDQAALAFTPRVGFGEAMNAWAVAMQKMVNGDDVETTLRALAEEIRTGL